MSGRPDHGAATVVVVALAGLLLMVGLGVVGVTAVVVTHRGAQSAADLAALAGADAVDSGGDACAAAESIARANGVGLRACEVLASDVIVRVSRTAHPGFGLAFDLTAQARAGPG